VDDDGTVDSNLATVTITVTNGLPIAADDTYQTNKNVALNVAAPGVLGNDSDPNSDPLTAVVDVNPSNGTLTFNSDGSFIYTPNSDYVGPDSFTYHANDGLNDSNIATVNLTINETCLYCDDFNDGNLDPNWTYIKQSWSESNGSLIGTPTGRTAIAVATPIYAGCQTCTIETKMRTAGGTFDKVWILGWYVDKKNTMELLMKEESDRWILKQRTNGFVVAKAKGIKTINPNTDYAVRLTFDGISFQVFVDDFVTPLFSLTPQAIVPVGTVGFKVKNTIGSFDYVTVN
jgi:Big-like domain-containing protein